jgi:hypothetical protein
VGAHEPDRDPAPPTAGRFGAATPMSHRIGRILVRFTEHRSEIQETALRDLHFRSSCEDYETAAEALEFWTSSSDPRRPKMVAEYRALVADLEAEIFQLMRNQR